ncbi:uncharacterized protein SAMN05216326_10516 [Nitrosomonas marina]|uniref:Uncharacterized protein n=2 Tax=Nitrosomonas marina TaxID=917 RepID=A0A1H9ZRC6_9PROT|nr:uncharacterized protein SAMN05216326_10516 [Nitrosomonas marina]
MWLEFHQPIRYDADPFMQLLSDAGLQHERRILQQFQSDHVVQQAASFDDTRALMEEGVPVIYQARLKDYETGLVGFPDFLIRHENGFYQAADAKLTQRENKKALQIQLGMYRRLLGGQLPAVVFLGNGRTASIGCEVDMLVDEFIRDMRQLHTLSEQPHVRYSHSRCRVCPYFSQCHTQFEASQDTSMLHGMHGRTAELLAQAGIRTIAQLAAQVPENIPDVPHLSSLKKKQRIVRQAQSVLHDEIVQLNDISLPDGTWIHFDIEDNPMARTCDRHVYLWGLLAPPYSHDDFDYVWTDDETQDYTGWQAFLEKIEQYRAEHASLVIAHYSNHEKVIIRKYAERYSMIDDGTVRWLLGLHGEAGPLFDIQNAVLDNLVLPVAGYGLKEICKHPKLVNFQWELESSGSQWSVVQFNRFQKTTDEWTRQQLKTELLTYNRDDVIATRKLELWLRGFSNRENVHTISPH